jgi:hypothetical protein
VRHSDLVIDWPEVEGAIPNLMADTPERQQFVERQKIEWSSIYYWLKHKSRPSNLSTTEYERFVKHASQSILDNEILYFLRFRRSLESMISCRSIVSSAYRSSIAVN